MGKSVAADNEPARNTVVKENMFRIGGPSAHDMTIARQFSAKLRSESMLLPGTSSRLGLAVALGHNAWDLANNVRKHARMVTVEISTANATREELLRRLVNFQSGESTMTVWPFVNPGAAFLPPMGALRDSAPNQVCGLNAQDTSNVAQANASLTLLGDDFLGTIASEADK